MADVTHGMRGTGSYPPNQRPGNFGKRINILGSRVSRDEVRKRLGRRKKK